MTSTHHSATISDTRSDVAAFDLHRSSMWLADQNLSDLDAHHADLVDVVDAVALAAGAPSTLRPSLTDPTPALVRLFNHHASAIARSQRTQHLAA